MILKTLRKYIQSFRKTAKNRKLQKLENIINNNNNNNNIKDAGYKSFHKMNCNPLV
jgi:hypothetical protein